MVTAPVEPYDHPGEPPHGEGAAGLDQRPASLGDRLLAQLVDGLVGFGLFFFAGMTLAPRFGGATKTGFELSGWPAAAVIIIVGAALLAYFVLAEAAFGVTLGKAVAGIRVQTPTGQRIGLRAALVRNLMRIVDGIGFYLVGAVAVLATRRHQRLGDLAVGSLVVQREPGRFARVAALLGALVLAAGGVVGGFSLRPAGRQVAGPAAVGPRAVTPAPAAAPVPAGRPRFATVVLSDNREATAERTIFSPDTERIYVVFTLADTPPETALRVLWIAEQVEGVPAGDSVGEYELKAGGPLDRGNFSLSRPADGWAPGTYRVELYLAGELAHSARFRIEGR
jgi:uncharacterized RDD family membrane protein YckC